MRPPWHDDYPLSVDNARAVLQADGIGLPLEHVDTFGSGWDFNTFRVDRDWLFRFPRRGNCVRFFQREVETLARLSGLFPEEPIAIPRYEWVVERSKAFPWAYGGYRFLEGTAVLDLDPDQVDVAACASGLGSFLRVLHTCMPSVPPRRVHDPFPNDLVHIREEFEQVREALPPEQANGCAKLLAARYPIWEGRPAFTHADLGPEHLLVRPSTGTLGAIIDWGDARWGDPLIDLVGWWAWGGDDAVVPVLATYGRDLDTREWARLRFRGACVAISQAYYGHASGRTGMLRRSTEWLARMLDAGQLDDVSAAPQSVRR